MPFASSPMRKRTSSLRGGSYLIVFLLMLAASLAVASPIAHAQGAEVTPTQLLEQADLAHKRGDYGAAFLRYVEAAEAMSASAHMMDPGPLQTDTIIRAANTWVMAARAHKAGEVGGPGERVQLLVRARNLAENHLNTLNPESMEYRATSKRIVAIRDTLAQAQSAEEATRRARELAAGITDSHTSEETPAVSEQEVEEAQAAAETAENAASYQLDELHQTLRTLQDEMKRERQGQDEKRRRGLVVGVGVSGGLTAVTAGVAAGLLASVRAGGPVHNGILEVANESEHAADYQSANDVCTLAEQRNDGAVVAECSSHRRILSAGYATSVGAGLLAATTVTFAVLLARTKKRGKNRASLSVAPVTRGLRVSLGLRF